MTTLLSLSVIVYNYRTKCTGGRFRVYSNGGLLFRTVVSFVPLFNFFVLLDVVFGPFGEFDTWLDEKTGKPCRRARLGQWWSRHNNM